jgi:hypothetical protein
MRQQIARVLWPAMLIEVGRSGAGGKPLLARPDRHRDHVLLQPLAVADAGVATGREHIDETLLDDHLHADVRIGGKERRDDGWQHEPRRADRNVELERAGRPVAKTVHHVEGGFYFCQCRTEPL